MVYFYYMELTDEHGKVVYASNGVISGDSPITTSEQFQEALDFLEDMARNDYMFSKGKTFMLKQFNPL